MFAPVRASSVLFLLSLKELVVTEVVTEVRVRTCDVTRARTRELLLTPGLSPAWEV